MCTVENYINRQNKTEWWPYVFYYVNKNLRFRIVNTMTAAIDDVLECLVEILNERHKTSLLVAYIRPPGMNGYKKC